MSQQKESNAFQKFDTKAIAAGVNTTKAGPGVASSGSPSTSLRGIDSEGESSTFEYVDQSTPAKASQLKEVKPSGTGATRAKRPAQHASTSPKSSHTPKKIKPMAPRTIQIRDNKLHSWFRDLKSSPPTAADIAQVAAVIRMPISWVEDWAIEAQRRSDETIAKGRQMIDQGLKPGNTNADDLDDEDEDGEDDHRERYFPKSTPTPGLNYPRNPHSQPPRPVRGGLGSSGDPHRGHTTISHGKRHPSSQHVLPQRASELGWGAGGVLGNNSTIRGAAGDRKGDTPQNWSGSVRGTYDPRHTPGNASGYGDDRQSIQYGSSSAQLSRQVNPNLYMGSNESKTLVEAKIGLQEAQSAFQNAKGTLGRAQQAYDEAEGNLNCARVRLEDAMKREGQ